MCAVLWIQITDIMYVRVTSEKAYILVYAHTYIHTYIYTCIHTSCTLTSIWICVRCKSSLGLDVVVTCVIFCITLCIVAFKFCSDLHLHLRTNMKVVIKYFKMKTYTYLHRTYVHTYTQECKWQAYILTIQVNAILTMEGQGVGVGVVAAVVVVDGADTLTYSKHSLCHKRTHIQQTHTYINTYIHTNKKYLYLVTQ